MTPSDLIADAFATAAAKNLRADRLILATQAPRPEPANSGDTDCCGYDRCRKCHGTGVRD